MNEKNDPNVQVIENATRDDVRPGDHLTWTKTWTEDGVKITRRREGIAHHRDVDGDWWAKEGNYLTVGEGERITITIRRPAQELPTEDGAVIVPAGGGEFIGGEGARLFARLTYSGQLRLWYGVVINGGPAWAALWYGEPEKIAPGTWKVADQ